MAKDDVSVEETLKRLENYVLMESRTLYFIVLGAASLFACDCSQDPNSLAFKILEYTVLTCCVMDTYFSIIITTLFLRPISKVLSDAQPMAHRSAAVQRLQKTKYDTLFGSSLAVVSSSMLYLLLLAFFDGRTEVFQNNVWLNPLIIGKHATARVGVCI
jgi:hypothetical protein